MKRKLHPGHQPEAAGLLTRIRRLLASHTGPVKPAQHTPGLRAPDGPQPRQPCPLPHEPYRNGPDMPGHPPAQAPRT